MNIEEVREYALSMNEQVTERLFADKWLSWRICGKWFLLMELDTPEPWVAVKLKPEDGEKLREQYEIQTMQYFFLPFYPLFRLMGQGNSMKEIALSQLVLARDGYPKFAVNPKDIIELAKRY